MNIILVSNNMAKAKALSLWQVALLLSSLVVATAMITAALILPQSALRSVLERLAKKG